MDTFHGIKGINTMRTNTGTGTDDDAINYQHHPLPGDSHFLVLSQCSKDNFSISMWKFYAEKPVWNILLEGYTEERAEHYFAAFAFGGRGLHVRISRSR